MRYQTKGGGSRGTKEKLLYFAKGGISTTGRSSRHFFQSVFRFFPANFRGGGAEPKAIWHPNRGIAQRIQETNTQGETIRVPRHTKLMKGGLGLGLKEADLRGNRQGNERRVEGRATGLQYRDPCVRVNKPTQKKGGEGQCPQESHLLV